jgi:hypothetical protein
VNVTTVKHYGLKNYYEINDIRNAGMCSDCGAIVGDFLLHDSFHRDLQSVADRLPYVETRMTIVEQRIYEAVDAEQKAAVRSIVMETVTALRNVDA